MPPQDTAHGRAMAAVTGALDLVRYFGRWGRRPAQHVLGNAGRFTYLLLDLARGLTEWRVYLPRMFTQATHIGYGSLFIVVLVAGFAGAVTSLQTGYQFTGALPLYYAGAVISESMILELGPVLTMFANATGILVGYLTAKGSLGLTYADFEYGARYFFRPLDLWYSLIKSYCFAGAVTLIPCY